MLARKAGTKIRISKYFSTVSGQAADKNWIWNLSAYELLEKFQMSNRKADEKIEGCNPGVD